MNVWRSKFVKQLSL